MITIVSKTKIKVSRTHPTKKKKQVGAKNLKTGEVTFSCGTTIQETPGTSKPE